MTATLPTTVHGNRPVVAAVYVPGRQGSADKHVVIYDDTLTGETHASYAVVYIVQADDEDEERVLGVAYLLDYDEALRRLSDCLTLVNA